MPLLPMQGDTVTALIADAAPFLIGVIVGAISMACYLVFEGDHCG